MCLRVIGELFSNIAEERAWSVLSYLEDGNVNFFRNISTSLPTHTAVILNDSNLHTNRRKILEPFFFGGGGVAGDCANLLIPKF
jgi:hypothetical protein